MRIVCISDTHNQHGRIVLPEGDVLIHAGDATGRGTRGEVLDFLNWLGSRKGYRAKIYVPGNHDFYVEEDRAIVEIFCIERGIKLLIDKPFVLDGVKFYGSPWVPDLQMWAFYGDHITLVSRFSRIPQDTDVLITHTPPFGVLSNLGSLHLGSKELSERVDELNLKLHVFGHIHESYGVHIDRHTSVNCAQLNEQYELTNEPVVFGIEDDKEKS